MQADYDIVIVGGGLAGMTLALQLRRELPELGVAVLERDALPPPIASHKVGESTVEIGAHYLSHTLGLEELLERTQLRKFGLRLFFGAGRHSDLAGADELGASSLLPAVSYQIDRGRLEGDLCSLLREQGVDVFDNCLARTATLAGNGSRHSVEVVHDDEKRRIQCRWLVDAASRTGFLKRRLGIDKRCGHRMVSAWLRLDRRIDVDDWSDSRDWRDRCNRPRLLSTNHLMGSGYWVWVIPLAGDRTSVGVVADPDIHPLESFNTIDRFCDWLARHQPAFGDIVRDARETLMDFRFNRNLSQDTGEFWSTDRWAMTGESGVFTDPFYSPGTDFIGISNTLVSDMIRREHRNDRFAVHAAIYERMYRSFFESTMSLYEGQYPGFGDTRLMVVKTTWDYAYYWSALTWLYFREVMTDIAFLREIQPQLVRMRALNDDMQALFRARAAQRIVDEGSGRFFDQVAIPVLYDLNAALVDPPAKPGKEFLDNCRTLDELAPVLESLLADEAGQGRCGLLGDLRQRFS